ncbi:uncharacterized protein M8220_005461 isoform 5-T10 [Acridotheres tristis]
MPMCMVIRGGNLWRLLSAPFKLQWILKARISSAQWLSRCSALLVACVSSEWTTRKMLTFHVQQEQLRSSVPLPTALPRDDHWDDQSICLPSTMLLHPCRCQAVGLAGDLGEAFGLRIASSAELTAALVWGAVKDTLGFCTCCPCLEPILREHPGRH